MRRVHYAPRHSSTMPRDITVVAGVGFRGPAAAVALKGGAVELLIGAAIAGLLLALVLLRVIWLVISRAVDNGLDWLIHNFGNDRAAQRVEEKWRSTGDG